MKRAFLLFLICSVLLGCSKSSDINTQYLGTWRLETHRGIHTILTFKNNGSFEVDLRIEGRHSKIVEKRGNVSGTWRLNKDETQLTLNITNGDPGIGWPSGTRTYDITKMDGRSLHLLGKDGRAFVWNKVRRQKNQEKADQGNAIIAMPPIVVNLKRSTIKSHQKYQWLCAKIDINLTGSAPAGGIHPKVQDKILMLLSAKTYGEVNSKSKLVSVTQELKNLINPYINGQVTDVVFRNIVVTGNKEAVREFNEKYESK